MVSELTAGSYRSAFRGAGLEFDEVREYSDGDNFRDIDWNVTARADAPFVKTWREERERNVFFLVDVSGSTAFASGARAKAELAAEFCAVLALSAAGSHDKVGLLTFSDRIERFVPARRGTRHALRVVRDILCLEPLERKTDIGLALDRFGRTSKKRAVLFLLSDFRGEGFEKPLRTTARRHDLVAVRIVDPREETLPARGLFLLRDPETGRIATVDCNSRILRDNFAALAGARAARLREICAKAGADLLEISTDRPFAERLALFLERRGRRFGR